VIKVLRDSSDSSESPLQVNFAGKAYLCFLPGRLSGIVVGTEGTLYFDAFQNVAVLPISLMLSALDEYDEEHVSVWRSLRSKLDFPEERDNVIALMRASEELKKSKFDKQGQKLSDYI
jgi:hypothetical protein